METGAGNEGDPQKPSPTAPAQPLPPNYKPQKDVEQPCMSRTTDVIRDINSIARMLRGKVSAFQLWGRFPGAQINPRGQSFGNAMSRLKKNGFVPATFLGIQSLDHPEGENFQKQFSDGLWYHAVVNFPTGTDSNGADPRRRTPLVTVHCHATDPTGIRHILDSIP